MQAGPKGQLGIACNWTSSVAYPSYVVFGKRKGVLQFGNPFPYDQFLPYQKSDVVGTSFIISLTNVDEFCYESICMSDLDPPTERSEYIVQVVGREGSTKDETALVFVSQLDGVSPPREVSLCGIQATEPPCDATQEPGTLRLTFKYPSDLGSVGNLPTDYLCEFSRNFSSFASGLAFWTTFPYEGKDQPARAKILKKSIDIPNEFVGVVLCVRLWLLNACGTGYAGISLNGVASVIAPSAPEIL